MRPPTATRAGTRGSSTTRQGCGFLSFSSWRLRRPLGALDPCGPPSLILFYPLMGHTHTHTHTHTAQRAEHRATVPTFFRCANSYKGNSRACAGRMDPQKWTSRVEAYRVQDVLLQVVCCRLLLENTPANGIWLLTDVVGVRLAAPEMLKGGSRATPVRGLTGDRTGQNSA